MKYDRLKENIEILYMHNELHTPVMKLTDYKKPETDLIREIVSDCREILNKIEQGTLIEFPRITETVYGLEWTVEYVSNMRTGTGIAKVFCGTEEQAKAVLEIVKKYGYPKKECLKELQE